MSEVSPAESATSVVVESNEPAKSESLEVTKTPEEYAQRLVEVSSEAKNYRLQLKSEKDARIALEDRLSKLEQERLENSGNYEDAYKSTKTELDQIKADRRQDHIEFATQRIKDQFQKEAVVKGCTDTDAFMKLVEPQLQELKSNIKDANYSVDPNYIGNVIEDTRIKYPKLNLFGKPAPTVHDGVPTPNSASGPSVKNYSDLSTKELETMFKS